VSSDGRFCGLLKSLRQNPFVRARKVYEQFSKEAGSLAQIGKDPAKTEQVTKVVLQSDYIALQQAHACSAI
jgi:hypothetical protein